MTDCIFCKIVSGEVPGKIVFQDDLVTAFHDINPSAPVHILVIPNKHITSINDLTKDDESLMGHLLITVSKIAKDEGIAKNGYRLIVNTGPHANQVVPHLHVHILGGHNLIHPMG
ncbi:MAG TPA: histidine triad nucleotide-binding protein [Anaerolineales bacterium]|nr:histidine triad nucleotide-binding protein [Anaerolineales bacterium]